ncbi:MAG: hypothetical protein AAGA42_11015 [Actinomycetota bacterium]
MTEGSGDGGLGGFGGFDNVRAEVERRGPPEGKEQWREGEGPQRRARPMLVLVVLALLLVVTLVAMLLFASGGSDDGVSALAIAQLPSVTRE